MNRWKDGTVRGWVYYLEEMVLEIERTKKMFRKSAPQRFY